MAWRIAKSLVVLRNQINSAYPNRSTLSDGTIGDQAHSQVASDHNPNGYGVVCAMDITHSPQTGFDAHALANNLVAHRHPNLKYVISNSRIAGAWTGWQWRQYNGVNPHSKHIHVSVGVGQDGQSDPGTYDDESSWAVGQSNNNKGEVMINDSDGEYLRINALMVDLRGRQLTRDEFRKFIVGQTWLKAVEIIQDSPEAQATRRAQEIGVVAIRDNWQGQIETLKKLSDELAQRPTKENFDALKAEIDTCTIDFAEAQKKAKELEQTQAENEKTARNVFQVVAEFLKAWKK